MCSKYHVTVLDKAKPDYGLYSSLYVAMKKNLVSIRVDLGVGVKQLTTPLQYT